MAPAERRMADLPAVFARSFAMPHMPCATATHAIDAPAPSSAGMADRASRPATWSSRPETSMRGMPKRVASHPPARFATIPAAS